MKGHKEHHHREHEKHRAKGGKVRDEFPKGGFEGEDEADMDLKDKTPDRVNAPNIDREADERKRGGRAKRAHGGHVKVHVHHEKMEHMKHAKHVGKVHGEAGHHHAGKAHRKSGGRAGADSHPFSSAHKGELRPGGREMPQDGIKD